MFEIDTRYWFTGKLEPCVKYFVEYDKEKDIYRIPRAWVKNFTEYFGGEFTAYDEVYSNDFLDILDAMEFLEEDFIDLHA